MTNRTGRHRQGQSLVSRHPLASSYDAVVNIGRDVFSLVDGGKIQLTYRVLHLHVCCLCGRNSDSNRRTFLFSHCSMGGGSKPTQPTMIMIAACVRAESRLVSPIWVVKYRSFNNKRGSKHFFSFFAESINQVDRERESQGILVRRIALRAWRVTERGNPFLGADRQGRAGVTQCKSAFAVDAPLNRPKNDEKQTAGGNPLLFFVSFFVVRGSHSSLTFLPSFLPSFPHSLFLSPRLQPAVLFFLRLILTLSHCRPCQVSLPITKPPHSTLNDRDTTRGPRMASPSLQATFQRHRVRSGPSPHRSTENSCYSMQV